MRDLRIADRAIAVLQNLIMNLFNFYIPEWIFVAVNLLILTGILYKLLWKRVFDIIDKRQKVISQSVADAEAITVERAALSEESTAREAELEKRTLALMYDARVRAGREYDRIVSEARERSQAIIVASEAQARYEYEATLRAAKSEIISAALGAAGALIYQNMDAKSNGQFIENYLEREGVLK